MKTPGRHPMKSRIDLRSRAFKGCRSDQSPLEIVRIEIRMGNGVTHEKQAAIAPALASIPNPFSSRYLRPDVVPFRPLPDLDFVELRERWQRLRFRASITGPHGAGKTCLWNTLLHDAETIAGLNVMRFQLPRKDCWGEIQLFLRNARRDPRDTRTIIGVDGLEQLRRWQRVILLRRSQRLGWGLLATCHFPISNSWAPLQTLCTLKPTTETLRQTLLAIRQVWLDDLQSPRRANQDHASDVLAAKSQFDALLEGLDLHRIGSQHAWDLRETLFSLYDRWEASDRCQ